MLPVSEHVEEAGEGGGGMSSRSAVSLLLVPSNSRELATAAVAVGEAEPEPFPTGKHDVVIAGEDTVTRRHCHCTACIIINTVTLKKVCKFVFFMKNKNTVLRGYYIFF